jgi:hypothetical protein
VEYDSDMLEGMSDHIMIWTKLQLQGLKEREKRSAKNDPPEKIYKWVEGSTVHNYATSA